MKPNLIFIAHRIPYPPNKGEKIRGFHLLQHLAQTYNIHLGCLADDPDDLRHAVTLRDLCADVAVFPIDKRRQKLKALATLRPGRPLMLDYYRHDGLRRWVEDTMTRQSMDVVYVYTVAMAPYVQQFDHRRVILDALDVDSEKWTAYARQARWPMRAVWAREGRTLLAYERQAAITAHATLFVSQAECDRFVQLAPETAGRVHPVEIGVDLERFAPGKAYPPPFEGEGPHLVFTGTMDYWPNVEAVQWFVSEILPLVRRRHAGAQFHIVGSSPSPAVLRLAAPGVHVTGRVADMRPYLAHADVCVAPLRIARGIQNKVLEAMAMGRPVVASLGAFEGISATPGRDLLVADGAAATAAAIGEILAGSHPAMCAAARQAMERGYAWTAVLRPLDAILASFPTRTVLERAP